MFLHLGKLIQRILKYLPFVSGIGAQVAVVQQILSIRKGRRANHDDSAERPFGRLGDPMGQCSAKAMTGHNDQRRIDQRIFSEEFSRQHRIVHHFFLYGSIGVFAVQAGPVIIAQGGDAQFRKSLRQLGE